MVRLGQVCLASAVLLCAAQSRAAEPSIMLPPLPPPIQKAPVVVEEYRSGWYLRGDLGYRMNDSGLPSVANGLSPLNSEYDDNYTFGGGGGYKSGWFRADVTVDWASKTNFKASTAAFVADYTMKLENITVLANVYFDLGTWGGFTPYVGAGAGMGWNRVHDFTALSSNVYLLEKSKSWDFAWAYMGGFSFNLAPNLLLDLNYRRVEFGDAKTHLYGSDERFFAKDLGAHEFRLGFRYNLD